MLRIEVAAKAAAPQASATRASTPGIVRLGPEYDKVVRLTLHGSYGHQFVIALLHISNMKMCENDRVTDAVGRCNRLSPLGKFQGHHLYRLRCSNGL